MSLRDILTLAGLVVGAVVLIDYFRLRRAEYSDARAAKALAAMSDHPSQIASCINPGCRAIRSAVCTDGRCRNHCRMYCECKGNK